MKAVDKYISENNPVSSSKLSTIEEDILKLLEHEFKAKQIHEYIVIHQKIDITQRRVYQYIELLKSRTHTKQNPQEVPKPQKSSTIVEKKEEQAEAEETEKVEEKVDDRKAAFMDFLKRQDELGIKPGVTEYKPKFESSWLKDE